MIVILTICMSRLIDSSTDNQDLCTHLIHQTMQPHSFHIPVMGLGYTIDTPVKVARFGINSVVSIIEDQLIENMREVLSGRWNVPYNRISDADTDHRALRITAYLNLLHTIVERQTAELKQLPFCEKNDLTKYFELLSDDSPLKELYLIMLKEQSDQAKQLMQRFLKEQIISGRIDVNIMTKLDRPGHDSGGNVLPPEYSDALAALRGYANSELSSSIIFSAGLNPKLYSYCESFPDFLPDATGNLKKKIVIKVSDYRSAFIQGKFLAKKGLWVSEFRIESGLNCGGHAFATDGSLLGPVLEEFRKNRNDLAEELYQSCQSALSSKSHHLLQQKPHLKITVQGGIGTTQENNLLLKHYRVDSTGWGSPFLLVPEVTNVDKETLDLLVKAKKDDYYLSHSSPLGVPFNNFRNSTSESQRKKRIEKKRPGSPCYKKFLAFDTEFTKEPICTASRKYQDLKIKQLNKLGLQPQEHEFYLNKITEKDCLCEGLGASALITNHAEDKLKLTAVAICPGPNLAWFSGIYSLRDMIDHIYGRNTLLNSPDRPHMFVNELLMNVDYLKNEIALFRKNTGLQLERKLNEFKINLLKGIDYYKSLLPDMQTESESFRLRMNSTFDTIKETVENMYVCPAVR